MQAIIMAAGKGSRLGNLTDDKPKSFLEVENHKLIDYNIKLLKKYGVRDIIIVTGYRCERFEDYVKQYNGVKCIFNPFYEMVNVLGSFYVAQEYLKEDTIYMHADTLCAPQIFEKMIFTDADMVLPVEFKRCDEEAMKVCTVDDKIIKISKKIPCDEAEGEFIGVAKIGRNVLEDLKKASKKLMIQKMFSAYFEAAIEELIKLNKYDIKAVSTEDWFWGEIDFLEDYERVKNEIPENLIEIVKENVR